MLTQYSILLFIFIGSVLSTEYTLNGLSNCIEVPANVSEIQRVAVLIDNLNPELTYEIIPIGGAIMYWPGNSAQNYDHFAWTLSITPENCGMGTDSLSPLCGSSNEFTCCWYSTNKLGSSPPLLHSRNSTSAFDEIMDNRIYIRGQYTVWAWFEDDNCSNNKGDIIFEINEYNNYSIL